MLALEGRGIEFTYPGQPDPIFTDVGFHVDSGHRIGLIGHNGSGKSTLIKIILGDLKPGSGTLRFAPGVRPARLDQELGAGPLLLGDLFWSAWPEALAMKRRTEEFCQGRHDDLECFSAFDSLGGYAIEARVLRAAAECGFTEGELSRPAGTLSGGEKTRASVCRAILSEPGFLLLDEPTNHLDRDALDWLEGFLPSLGIPFVAASHDREFLDRCCNVIWEVNDGGIAPFTGNFSEWDHDRETRLRRAVEEREEAMRKVARLREAAAQKRGAAMRRENFRKPRSVKKNGGICKRDEFRPGPRKEQSLMKAATAVEARLEKEIEKTLAALPGRPRREYRFEMEHVERGPRVALTVEGIEKTLGEKRVLEGLGFHLPRGARLEVAGPNGSGKTTLLRILTGILQADAGEVRWSGGGPAYFSQELEHLDPDSTPLSELSGGDPVLETRARNLMGRFRISGAAVFRKLGSMSPGERCKIALCGVLMSKAPCLVLDEPMNHLEIESRKALEEALGRFEGTLVIVSHDRRFLKSLVTHRLTLPDGDFRETLP